MLEEMQVANGMSVEERYASGIWSTLCRLPMAQKNVSRAKALILPVLVNAPVIPCTIMIMLLHVLLMMWSHQPRSLEPL